MRKDKIIPHKKVCVAVIRDRRGKILIARRLPKGSMGGLWEFPGGKIEANETVIDCIIREIQEELAVTVKVEQHLITIEHNYKDFYLTLIAHLCSLVTPPKELEDKVNIEPIPIASSEILWVSLSEIDRYNFPAANDRIITTLKNLQQERQLFV